MRWRGFQRRDIGNPWNTIEKLPISYTQKNGHLRVVTTSPPIENSSVVAEHWSLSDVTYRQQNGFLVSLSCDIMLDQNCVERIVSWFETWIFTDFTSLRTTIHPLSTSRDGHSGPKDCLSLRLPPQSHFGVLPYYRPPTRFNPFIDINIQKLLPGVHGPNRSSLHKKRYG